MFEFVTSSQIISQYIKIINDLHFVNQNDY